MTPSDLGSNPLSATVLAGPVWQADCGDGTYRNPILYADYSDPDVIRHGDDYWMTASSFSHVPGLPILHSRDLINWRLVNHALTSLVPYEHFSIPRPGCGVWAPSLRHHAGKFWIFYPDPDFGIYVITAMDPRGTWSPPYLLKAGKGLIDPCPFWDDDGQAYLIHGWARSRSGISNVLTLHRMSSDGAFLLEEGGPVIDGGLLEGWHTLEGPKLYKRDGYYYVFAPAGGVADGYQAVFRSRTIRGPYEARIVLRQGASPINGPHQGAWVQTVENEHWFFHFQDKGAYGRIVHLQPMQWRSDGWPAMGQPNSSDGAGEPVLLHKKPVAPQVPIDGPATSDDFNQHELGRQWQWQANPRPEWASANPSEKTLTLLCVPFAGESLWLAPHLLLQKFPAPAFEVTTSMTFEPRKDGDAAGLIVFGYDYAWIGLQQNAGVLELVCVTCTGANETGARETIFVSQRMHGGRVSLRATVNDGASVRFSYSSDQENFVFIGAPFQSKPSRWVGAKIGLFANSKMNGGQGGCAIFRRFAVAPNTLVSE